MRSSSRRWLDSSSGRQVSQPVLSTSHKRRATRSFAPVSHEPQATSHKPEVA